MMQIIKECLNLLFNQSIYDLIRPNDDISTHSSVKSQKNDILIFSSASDSRELIRPSCLIGGKKGRPMTDMNIIVDEVNNKIYDPLVDPEEYKKARKFIFLNQAFTKQRKCYQEQM